MRGALAASAVGAHLPSSAAASATGTGSSANPTSSRSVGTRPWAARAQAGQDRVCRAMRLRHSGPGRRPNRPPPRRSPRAPGLGVQRRHERPAQFQLVAHPLDAYARVRDARCPSPPPARSGSARRRSPATTATAAPGRRGRATGRPGHLPALAGQFQPQHRGSSTLRRRPPPRPPRRAPPSARRASRRYRCVLTCRTAIATNQGRKLSGARSAPQFPQRAQHGLLHDVVDVRVAVQRPAYDGVDQRQVRRDELVQRPPVARLRGGDQARLASTGSSHFHVANRRCPDGGTQANARYCGEHETGRLAGSGAAGRIRDVVVTVYDANG